MTHAPDPLLPNSRTQSLKLLLLENRMTEPWYLRLARAFSAAFRPIWRTR